MSKKSRARDEYKPDGRDIISSMGKLQSIPLYPVSLSVGGILANLVKNRTPEGRFQIARVLKPGGPHEGDFDVLWEGDSEADAEAFARAQVEKDSPGLLAR